MEICKDTRHFKLHQANGSCFEMGNHAMCQVIHKIIGSFTEARDSVTKYRIYF